MAKLLEILRVVGLVLFACPMAIYQFKLMLSINLEP